MTWRIENEPGREPNRQMAWGMHTAAAYSLSNGEYVSLTFSRASCSRGRVNSGVLRHQTQQLAGRELGAPTAPLAISSLVFGKSLCTAAENLLSVNGHLPLSFQTFTGQIARLSVGRR